VPEGDTIHRVAAYLAERLSGRALVRAELRGEAQPELAGRRVERVEPRGKHLFVELEGDRVLRSHLGMHGSWHHYAPGERWKRPALHAGVVLATERGVFVCFHPSEVELVRKGGLRERDARRRVGIDLAHDDVPAAEVARQARARLAPKTPIVDVLLDQRVAGGIGNVYKSEVLFVERVPPSATLAELDDDRLTGLFARARELLRRNLAVPDRRTRADDGRGELWVYGRAGEPCLVCGTPVEHARLGRGARDTYTCPTCVPTRRSTPER